jgi:hypothetical protein
MLRSSFQARAVLGSSTSTQDGLAMCGQVAWIAELYGLLFLVTPSGLQCTAESLEIL